MKLSLLVHSLACKKNCIISSLALEAACQGLKKTLSKMLSTCIMCFWSLHIFGTKSQDIDLCCHSFLMSHVHVNAPKFMEVKMLNSICSSTVFNTAFSYLYVSFPSSVSFYSSTVVVMLQIQVLHAKHMFSLYSAMHYY